MAKATHYTAINRPPKVKLMCTEDEGKTRQSDKEGCDINKIMARYVKTGVIPVDQRQGMFMDVSEMPDYQSALENVINAEKLFMSLPAKLRKEFGNDPATFLDFCSDPENATKLVELGLMPDPDAGEPEPEPAPEPEPSPPPAP